jgi:hypothetical protein
VIGLVPLIGCSPQELPRGRGCKPQAPSPRHPLPPPAQLNPSSSTGVCSPFNLSRLDNLSFFPHDPRHDPHDPHDPHDSHDPHNPHDTRLLRFALDLHRVLFAAAVAGCAPPRCVIAPRPELEKAWLFGRRSRPPPASVRPPLHSPQPHRRALPTGPEPPTSLTLLVASSTTKPTLLLSRRDVPALTYRRGRWRRSPLSKSRQLLLARR